MTIEGCCDIERGINVGFDPSIVYKDRSAAMQWLQRTFGFETTIVVQDADGSMWMAEEESGQTATKVARKVSPLTPEGLNTQSVEVVVVDGIDSHFARAGLEPDAAVASP